MLDEVVITEEQIEAAVGVLFKEYQTGAFLHNQILCPTDKIAHTAYRSFKRQLEKNHLPNDIIIDVSSDRLKEIQTSSTYETLRNTGLTNAFALCVSVTLYDNATKLGTTIDDLNNKISAEAKNMPTWTVINLLDRLVRRNPTVRAVTVFDDFVETIHTAEELGLQANILPQNISRTIWDKLPDTQRFSMIGFTRPNEATMDSLQKHHMTANGFYNDIAYLQQKRIQSIEN